jgi:ABC-type branched-subunit amino acid transport system substrate-binding protein
MATLLKEQAAAEGITITVLDNWTSFDPDMNTVATKLAASVKDIKPDAIALLGTIVDVPQIVSVLKSLGVTQPIIAGQASAYAAAFGIKGPEAIEGMTVIGPAMANVPALPDDYPRKQEMLVFVERYKAKFNADPDYGSALGHDAVHILAEAIKIGGDDATKIRDAIESVNYQGLDVGPFSPTNHYGVGALNEWKAANGQWTFVRTLN